MDTDRGRNELNIKEIQRERERGTERDVKMTICLEKD